MATFWTRVIHVLASAALVISGKDFDDRWQHWWGYDAISGPRMWGEMVQEYSLCSTGKQQSPIDIQPEELLFDPNLKHVKIESLPVNGRLINTGNDITFLLDNEFTTSVNVSEGPLSYVYHVTAIKFHFSKSDASGSEHHVAGQAFPAEMQIIGYNGNLYNNMSKAENSSNGIVVLSSFLKINLNEDNSPNSALNVFTSSLQSLRETPSSVPIKFFSIPELLPKTDHYMTYDGSMTQPSCQETVTWIIFNKATYLSEGQLNAFRKVPMEWTESNSRPLMPLNHRVVRTNIDTKKKTKLFYDFKTGTISLRYDKRDDFDFRIVNFPFILSNLPESPAYGVYISQLIRYARACSLYGDFVSRSKSLTAKLVEQGYTKDKLKVYVPIVWYET